MKLKKAGGYWKHWCPACGDAHIIPTQETHPGAATWEFNGDAERPTFHPSILIEWGEQTPPHARRCHYFIVDGDIQFCEDSTHALAGKTVPLPEIP